MKSTLSLLSFLALVACTGEPPATVADAAPGFTAPVVASAATSNGATPMFAVANDGKRVLSWVAAEDGGSDGVLHVQVERPGNTPIVSTFRDPLGGIEPHGEAPPVVSVGTDGTIYALYTVGKDVGQRFPKSALRFTRSENDGATWSEPISVNEGEAFGSHNFHALLAGEAGIVYAAWLSSVRGESGVWLRASPDGGRTWDVARLIHAEPTCPCCRTGLALGPDGMLYASYRKIFDGDVRDVVVMASRDGGTTWGAPVKPRDDGWVFPGCPHAGPSLKVDAAGTVHIAWWTGKTGAVGVWYARSTDRGTTWRAAPIDTAAKGSPAHVQLALDGSRVVVAWDDGHGPRPQVLLRTSTDGGATFGAETRLSDANVAASYPVLGIHHDSVTVAWSQTADSAYRAMLAARPDMKDPNAKMTLPRVGQQEVLVRTGRL
jgi:hypothetical protein